MKEISWAQRCIEDALDSLSDVPGLREARVCLQEAISCLTRIEVCRLTDTLSIVYLCNEQGCKDGFYVVDEGAKDNLQQDGPYRTVVDAIAAVLTQRSDVQVEVAFR